MIRAILVDAARDVGRCWRRVSAAYLAGLALASISIWPLFMQLRSAAGHSLAAEGLARQFNLLAFVEMQRATPAGFDDAFNALLLGTVLSFLVQAFLAGGIYAGLAGSPSEGDRGFLRECVLLFPVFLSIGCAEILVAACAAQLWSLEIPDLVLGQRMTETPAALLEGVILVLLATLLFVTGQIAKFGRAWAAHFGTRTGSSLLRAGRFLWRNWSSAVAIAVLSGLFALVGLVGARGWDALGALLPIPFSVAFRLLGAQALVFYWIIMRSFSAAAAIRLIRQCDGATPTVPAPERETSLPLART